MRSRLGPVVWWLAAVWVWAFATPAMAHLAERSELGRRVPMDAGVECEGPHDVEIARLSGGSAGVEDKVPDDDVEGITTVLRLGSEARTSERFVDRSRGWVQHRGPPPVPPPRA